MGRERVHVGGDEKFEALGRMNARNEAEGKLNRDSRQAFAAFLRVRRVYFLQ